MGLYIFVLGNKLKGIDVLVGQPWDSALLLTVLVAVRYLLHIQGPDPILMETSD